jgi:hypothetical protein
MSTEPTLAALSRLLGKWTTEATHPAMPGVVVQGSVEVTWLEGERFLIHRARSEHPDFPDSISILGVMGKDRVAGPHESRPDSDGEPRLCMHYFDSRGVFRVYEASIDETTWRLWRNATGFSQRFSGRVEDEGKTIVGRWELCEDDVHWTSDLEITYRRSRTS